MSDPGHEPPEGLEKAGRALWAAVLATFELRADEELILQAAHEVDLITGLQRALDRDGITAPLGNRVRSTPLPPRSASIASCWRSCSPSCASGPTAIKVTRRTATAGAASIGSSSRETGRGPGPTAPRPAHQNHGRSGFHPMTS